MLYGYMENGELKLGPTTLPRAWKNISGFDVMTPSKYPLLGWFPWEEVVTDGEVFDHTTIEVKDSKLVYTKHMRPRTAEEIQAELEAKTSLLRNKRREAYLKEADPLFMKWQRGEVTKEEWLAVVDEIKERYPYPTA